MGKTIDLWYTEFFMKPYSLDLRERVLAALDGGMARSDAVRIFQVSLGSIKRWLVARQATGTVAPKQARGGPVRTITSAHDDAIRAHVAARPDATLADRATHWNALHGTSISQRPLRPSCAICLVVMIERCSASVLARPGAKLCNSSSRNSAGSLSVSATCALKIPSAIRL